MAVYYVGLPHGFRGLCAASVIMAISVHSHLLFCHVPAQFIYRTKEVLMMFRCSRLRYNMSSVVALYRVC